MVLITSEVCSTITNQAHSQDFQKGGLWDWAQRVGMGGGSLPVEAQKLREYTSFWKPKNVPGHHKYVQLSASNHVLLIPSRIGVVMTLVLKLWPGIIVARCKHMRFLNMLSVLPLWTAAAKMLQ